jgi:membrane protein implicated in regulation of membrane protease activity
VTRRKEDTVEQWVNWSLIIVGLVMVVLEVVLGVITGFDLMLLGIALTLGGAVGLVFGSTKVGLFAAGAFAFLYLAFVRRRLRDRVTTVTRATNIDVVIGRTALVTERIAPHAAGMVRLGDELWRATLKDEGPAAVPVEPGATVVVDSVEGVTLKVR